MKSGATMKCLGFLLLLNVFIMSRCEIDFPVLTRVAQLLEKDGKLTADSIQPYSFSDIDSKVKEATVAYIEHCKRSYLVNKTLYIPMWNISKDIKEAQSFVRGNLRDVQIKNLDSLRFHNLTTNLANLTATYGVYFEEDLVLSGLYQIHGEFIGQKLSGEGVFDITIKGMKVAGVTAGSIQDKHAKISSLENSLDMDDIKINITNFTIENFSQEELTTLINSAALIYVKQYQDLISKLGAPLVIQYVNSLVRDKTVTQLQASVIQSLTSEA